ncbi:glycosyltransferase family 4 protein [Patescibacteria group bacterium]|nr:glycosyltransferase family 4 protein [Patescibacteria group bacterium]
MKLLIVTQKVDMNDPVLGFFHAWLEEFARQCERVTVICLQRGETRLPQNVTVYSLGKERRPSRVAYLWRLYRFVLRERKNYDAVLVHMNPEYVILCGPLWKILGKRVALWYTHKAVNMKLLIAARWADKIFTASAESFRLPSKKLSVLGHGIDAGLFARHPSHAPVTRLLTVGRVSDAKDVRTLILGVGEVHEQQPEAPLVFDVVGGPAVRADECYLHELENLVASWELGGVVRFLGERTHTELPAIYAAYGLFLHASRTGSMDKVVLEALAAGLPVITSSEAYPGFPNVHRFTPGDPHALARGIMKMIAEKPSAADAEHARSFIRERYGLGTLIGKIVHALEH